MTFVYDQEYGYGQDGKPQSPERRQYFELSFGTEGTSFSFTVYGSDSGAGYDSTVSNVPVVSADNGTGTDTVAPIGTGSAETSAGGEGSYILASLASADVGTGIDAGVSVISKISADVGSGTEALALMVGASDRAGMLDGLLAEWGVSWGAVDLDLQVMTSRVTQGVVAEAELILLAEES